MATVWNGADPTGTADANPYEMGSIVTCLEAVSLEGIRVWSPVDAIDRAGREGHVWDLEGTLMATISMPESLPSGWSTHSLTTPIALSPGDVVMVSYETNGNYGAVADAFAGEAHVSTDGAMSFPESAAVNGNGRFIPTPGSFPNQTFNETFYGIDGVYTVASGTAPTITDLALSADGLDVTATITATDPDGLAGASYRYEWGDGTVTTSSSASVSHTYTDGGTKTVMVRVTDSAGLTDHEAASITIGNPTTSRALRLVRRGQRRAEALMLDTCTIRRVTGTTTVDGTVTPTYSTLYTGRCKLQSQKPWPSNPEAGEHSWALVPLSLHVPVGSGDFRPDDIVTIDSSVNPVNAGRQLRIKAPEEKTLQTALRFLVEEVAG